MMAVTTIEDAKTHALNVTSGKLSPEQAQARLESFKRYKDNASREEEKQKWQEQINELDAWINSEQFKRGDYPQGIDTLMLDLIEWRSMIYAFTHATTKANPFEKSLFFSQWITGTAYAVLSTIGKLNGHRPDEVSLRGLWNEIKPFIELDGVRSKDEILYIDQSLKERLTKSKSKALQFRHTVVAHNAKSLNVSWDDLDPDIQILARTWGLVVSWCSYGILFPFLRSEEVFIGLESYYDGADLRALCAKRDEYIERAKGWCKTHLHNDVEDKLPGPFASFSITIGHAAGVAKEG